MMLQGDKFLLLILASTLLDDNDYTLLIDVNKAVDNVKLEVEDNLK